MNAGKYTTLGQGTTMQKCGAQKWLGMSKDRELGANHKCLTTDYSGKGKGMRKTIVCLLAVVCLAWGMGIGLAAEPVKVPSVQTHLKRVALFKNGFGFFVREGTLSDDKSVVVLGPFAAPTHGTFWVSSPSRAQLASLVAREVTVPEKFEARTVYELLRANIGREVRLGGPWDGAAIVGKILGFAPERPAPAPAPEPYGMGLLLQGDGGYPSGPGGYMLIETTFGVIALDPSNYGTITFPSKDISTVLYRDSMQFQLEATLGQPKAGDWLSVSYLARGITWVPSYLIDISDPKQARLSAKALIINEAEDLQGTHIDLITGFPNLQFADLMSPISKKESLAQFLQALARGPARAEEVSVMTQNVAFMSGGRGGAGGGGGRSSEIMPGYGRAVAGQVAEDLFLYPLENVNLMKGETGYYPLFTETAPYTEFYDWQVPDYIGFEGYYGRQGQMEEPQVVWHSIRLTNETKMPWTTAPVQLLKDGQIIGQDTLNYTAPTAETIVKITRAVSVHAEQTEVELSREREAIRMYGDSFDRVTIKGTLIVTNYKDKLVSVEITKTVSGELKETDPKAKDITLARGLRAMNPVHELTWKVELKPGESREVSYTYQALIRR